MNEKLPQVSNLEPLASERGCGQWFYDPALRELCKKTRRKADLNADEIVLLALGAGQAALTRYLHPGNRDAEKTLNEILGVLDHDAVGTAVDELAQKLLAKRDNTMKSIQEHADG